MTLNPEDAVSIDKRPVACENLGVLPESPVPYYVKNNAADTGILWDDVVAARRSDAVGVILPKADDLQVIHQIDGALTVMEKVSGKPEGSVTLIALMKSATPDRVGVVGATHL